LRTINFPASRKALKEEKSLIEKVFFVMKNVENYSHMKFISFRIAKKVFIGLRMNSYG
jgi:hypothetical protein